jgi:hypothetical protein
MKYVLLATAAVVAATAFPTAPAQAQSSASAAFVGVPAGSGGFGVRVHRGFGGGGGNGGRHDRDGRFDDGGQIGTWYEGGQWALYNNRSWEPDSYNDWWHDRPDRAFPRWVQNNQLCQRQWWSGGGWRC